jgi:hypothetical protein
MSDLSPPSQSYGLPFAAYDSANNPVAGGFTESIVPSGNGFWTATVSVPSGADYVTLGSPFIGFLTYSATDGSYKIDTTPFGPLYQNTLSQLGIQDPNFPLLGSVTFLPDSTADMTAFMPTAAAKRRTSANPGLSVTDAAAQILSDLQSGAIASVAMGLGDVLCKLTAAATANLKATFLTGDAAPLSYVYARLAAAASDMILEAVRTNPWVTGLSANAFLDLIDSEPGSSGGLPAADLGSVSITYDDSAQTTATLMFPAGAHRFVLPVPSGAIHGSLTVEASGQDVPVQPNWSGTYPQDVAPPSPCAFTLPSSLAATFPIVFGQPNETLLYNLQLSSDVADESNVPDVNPQPFKMGVTSYPPVELDALPPFKVPTLMIPFDEVCLMPGPGVQDFDVDLSINPAPPSVQWSIDSATLPQSGDLNGPTSAQATFANPATGGVYLFDIVIPGQKAQTVLSLPLAGAEISSIVQADLARVDTFAANALATFSSSEIVEYAFKWFWTGGNGDYLGRPENPASPTFRRLNRIEAWGTGAVATWFGVPIRLAKATNFLFAYACQQLEIASFLQSTSHLSGTLDDASSGMCYTAGKAVATGGDYTTLATQLVTSIWNQADEKNRLLWPNPNPATNHVASQALVTNILEQFVSPGFINYFD